MNDFEKDDKFPVSFPAIHIAFGSFARRTKIRPLDDIDLMFGLTGQGATYTILSDRITVTSSGEGHVCTVTAIPELTPSAPSEF